MSVCGQTGQTEEDSASEEAGASASARELHKQKPASKVVRVLTVLAYLLSVSLAAILLSVYYVCAWTSSDLPRNESQVAARTGNHSYYNQTDYSNFTGGGDTAVNDTTTQPANIAVGRANNLVATDELTTSPADTLGPPATPRPRSTPNDTSVTIGSFNGTDSIT